MKTYVHVFLLAACLVACAHGLPGARRESSEELADDFDFPIQNFFADTINRLRQNLLNYFWDIPSDFSNIKIPEGANTTSTVKIINGHVVTINETTYTSGDDISGSAFRIRIIDVKPQNETVPTINDGAEPSTPKAETTESAETVEDFNNEISKNVEVLNA